MPLIRRLIASLLLMALSACGAATVIGPTATPAPPTAAPPPPQMSGRIVYVDRDRSTIKTVLPDGTDDRVLTTVVTTTGQIFSSLSASPDGQFLAYSYQGATGNGTMRILRTDGSVVRTYQSTGAPTWSPDGQHFVAPIIESEVPTNLSVVYPSGSDDTVTPLARFEGGSSAWFPDGKRLAYVRDKSIHAFDLETDASQPLAGPPEGALADWQVKNLYVQPDGARIWAYAGNFDSSGADGMRWWSLPAGGGEMEPLLERQGQFIGALDLAPTGRMLGFVEGALASTCDAPQADTLYLSPDFSAEQPTIQEAALPGDSHYEIFGFAWEAGGQRVAFAAQPYVCQEQRRQLFPDSNVYVWPIDGSQRPTMVATGAFPAWIR